MKLERICLSLCDQHDPKLEQAALGAMPPSVHQVTFLFSEREHWVTPPPFNLRHRGRCYVRQENGEWDGGLVWKSWYPSEKPRE